MYIIDLFLYLTFSLELMPGMYYLKSIPFYKPEKKCIGKYKFVNYSKLFHAYLITRNMVSLSRAVVTSQISGTITFCSTIMLCCNIL
jgi:hypothetical protein